MKAEEAAQKKPKYLEIKNHMYWHFIFQVVSFTMSITAAFNMWPPMGEDRGAIWGIIYAVYIFIFSVGAWWITGMWFRTFFFARCPECSGKTVCRNSRPLKYNCTVCDYSAEHKLF